MAVNKMTSSSQIKDILKELEHKMKIYDIESILKDQRPTLRSATSSSTWPVANRHWVAIGDAACTLDPLSSTGLLHAIRSACKGARAIKNSLNGNFNDLESYSKMTNQFFQKYIHERQQVYLNSKITL
jgi:flavin-dependent dehydrogenase